MKNSNFTNWYWKGLFMLMMGLFVVEVSAQTIDDGDLPNELVVCGDADTLAVVVTGPLAAGTLTADLPPGYIYVSFDASESCAGSSENSPNPTDPVFNVPALAAGVQCTISYIVRLDCDAFRTVDENQGGNPDFLFITQYTHSGGPTGSSAPTIQQQNPKLTTDVVVNGSPASPGIPLVRTIRICQDGTDAYIDADLIVGNDLDPGLSILSATIQGGGPALAVDGSNNITVPQALFAAHSKDRMNVAGNGDDRLDGSLSSDPLSTAECIYIDIELMTDCMVGDLVHKVITNWGCDAESCAIDDTTSISTNNIQGTPILSRRAIPEKDYCYLDGPSSDTMRFINTGNGAAMDIQVRLWNTSSGAGLEVVDDYKSIDLSSIQYRINDGSFTTPTVLESTPYSGIAYCSAQWGATGKVIDATVEIPSLPLGDTLYVVYDVYTCCSEGSCASWENRRIMQEGIFQNSCGVGDFIMTPLTGTSLSRITLAQTEEIEPDINDGEHAEIAYIITNQQNSNWSPRWKHCRVITFDCGLLYDGNLEYVNRNGTPKMFSSVNWNPATLELELCQNADVGGIAFRDRLEVGYMADCNASCGATGGTKNIKHRLYWSIDTSCTTECTYEALCSDNQTILHCPLPCPWDNITPRSFVLYRTTLGNPDYDNDGLPDNNSTADPARVRSNRATQCDIIEGKAVASVSTIAAVPATDFLEFGYADISITPNGSSLMPIPGRIEWWDADLMTWHVCDVPVPPGATNGTSVEWDYSPATLAAGCPAIAGLTFGEGDSVKFYPRYEITGNIGGVIALQTADMNMYGATMENPPPNTTQPCGVCNPIVYPDNRYTCDKYTANYTLIGHYFTTGTNPQSTNANCAERDIFRYHYFSMGDCCSNYNGGNIFENEYRPFATLDSGSIFIPDGWDVESFYLIFNRTAGTGASASVTIDPIVPVALNPENQGGVDGVKYFFDYEQYHEENGGPIPVGDDGWRYDIHVRITPTCALPSGEFLTAQWTNWGRYDHCPSNASSLSPNWRLRFIQPNLISQSDDRFAELDCPEVSWPLRIVNISDVGNANNVWVYIPPSDIQVNDIQLGGASLTENNGFYEVGDILITETKNLEIFGTSQACKMDSIPALVGFSCDGYPTNPDELNCDPDTIWLVVIPQFPDFSVQILEPTNTMGVDAQLCDTIDYEFSYKNEGDAKSYDIEAFVFLPKEGIEIVPGSVEIEYPCGSGYVAWEGAYPTSVQTFLGQLLNFDITGESVTNANIDPIGAAPDDGWVYPNISEVLNCFGLKFKVVTDCDLDASGDFVRTAVRGNSPCGLQGDRTGRVRSKLENVGPINIDGADPYAIDIDAALQYDYTACGGNFNFDFDLTMLSAATSGPNDSIQLKLPAGFGYVSDNYGTPVVETLPDGTIITWVIDPPLTAGAMASVDVEISVDESVVGCTNETFDLRTFTSVEVTCDQEPTPFECDIITNTSNEEFFIFIDKPDLEVSIGATTVTCNGGSTASAPIAVDVTNNGPAIPAGVSFPVRVFANNDGTCSELGDNTELGVINVSGPIAVGQTVNFSRVFAIPFTACNVLARIENCICEGEAGAVDCGEIEMILPDNGPFEACHNEETTISTCDNGGMVYTWEALLPATDADFVSGTNTGTVVIRPMNTSGSIQTYKYVVRVDRGLAACREVDTLEVTVRPSLQPSPIKAEKETVCPTDMQVFEYCVDSISTATSYTWSVPAGATITSEFGKPGQLCASVDWGSTSGDICLTASDGICADSTECLAITVDPDVCCDLTVTTGPISECNDNGTPTDPSDDYFVVTLTADATNPGASGSYEVLYNGTVLGTTTYGLQIGVGNATTPPFVANGSSTYDIVVRDVDLTSDCEERFEVGPVDECSDECAIEITQMTTNACNDNGTPTNPDDDYFTVTVNAANINDAGPVFEVLVNGILLGSSSFGTPITVGTSGNPPFKADGTTQYVVEVRSQSSPDCIEMFDTDLVDPCSDECTFAITQFSQGICNDNGTPTDPSDDWYSITVNASAVNGGPADMFEVVYMGTVLGTSTYGTPVVVGTAVSPPFKADGSSTYTVLVRDTGKPDCNQSFTTTEVTSCSDDCALTITTFTESACNDNGTPTDPTDDFFTLTVGATAMGGGAAGMFEVVLGAAGNGSGGTVIGVGVYGNTVTIGDAVSPPFKPGMTYAVTVRDLDDNTCHEDRTTGQVDGCSAVTHDKSIVTVVQTGIDTWTVTYRVEVDNLGGGLGTYDLIDTPAFDDDIEILSASYTSDAPGNAGGGLSLTGPWDLATDQDIVSMVKHTYTITVDVQLDLSAGSGGDDVYSACESGTPGNPQGGEGLYNMTELDANNDGQIDEEDEVCADVPYITHEKSLVSTVQQGNGTYNVTYQIVVTNLASAGSYSLKDEPMFDDDIEILGANYSSNVPSGGPLLPIPPLAGGWTLANNQSLAGGSSHTYFVVVNVDLDLSSGSSGDNVYTECGNGGETPGEPGEGLYNRSYLDVTGDGDADEEDDACGDLPAISHEKVLVDIMQTGARCWTVRYDITVENAGGASGRYNLFDIPMFDDDIEIQGARYASSLPCGPFIGTTNLGASPWQLADGQNIDAGVSQCYRVMVDVCMDLEEVSSAGDEDYTSCGEGTGGISGPGQGLYNRSQLDNNDDGDIDEEDDACGDLPYVVHEKTLNSITQTGPRTWDVEWKIEVNNLGGGSGAYDLSDTPDWDDDIAPIISGYSTDAPGNAGNPGPELIANAGERVLADDQAIAGDATHTYIVEASVSMDLNGGSTPGDGVYTACESGTPGDPTGGEGLYNGSALDVNNDGSDDEEDEACGDLPNIDHEKSLVSIEVQGDGSFNVVYEIKVTNSGGASDTYNLEDEPLYDDDIDINSASYVSDAAGNPGGALVGSGPWSLASDQSLEGGGAMHVYTLTVNVSIDLSAGSGGDNVYNECESGTPGDPQPGEGVYNVSHLDLDDDGNSDQDSEVCGDIASVVHEKSIVGVTQIGARNWRVVYEIEVRNEGGAEGVYDLEDAPGFDDDAVIDASSYVSDAAGNPGGALAGVGPWSLADDQTIAGGVTHLYTLTVDVTLDLNDPNTPGDGDYAACEEGNPGEPRVGEGLFNESRLDLTNDGVPEQRDTACGDVPYVTHEKELSGVVQTGAREWTVTYSICVRNDGGAEGMYVLTDKPEFEDDIEILSALVSAGGPPAPLTVPVPVAGWEIAGNTTIGAGAEVCYDISVNVRLDLTNANTPGDGNYDECASNPLNEPQPGEGLFNGSSLDVNNDGTDDEEDEACGDLPNVVHVKRVVNFFPMANGNHMVVYEIVVSNLGGAEGEYTLWDSPDFDDDIEIIAGNYTSTTPAGGALGVPVPVGGWELNRDQDIAPGDMDTYTIEVEVDIDLSAGSGGDNVISDCGSNGSGSPVPGEALYNSSQLDVNGDDDVDEEMEACSDVPDIMHEKTIISIVQNPDDSYCVTYSIRVENEGKEDGFYDLYDFPMYDDDIQILNAEYMSSLDPTTMLNLPVPPPNGWKLADDVRLRPDDVHLYTLKVCVFLDLDRTDGLEGDRDYTACGEGTQGIPTAGQGLYNESRLDLNDDGTPDMVDDVCGDIPHVIHDKEFVSATYDALTRTYNVVFEVEVENVGGADGEYDLWDQPSFDDDVVINSSSYVSDAPGNAGGALAGTGPWTLADDQDIVTGGVHVYTMTVNVSINLSDPATVGDEVWTWCESGTPGDPEAGEGFYNESYLDRSNDGTPEENDETCGDVEIVDMALTKDLVTAGPYAYDQVVDFAIEVTNQGNIDMYDIVVNDYLPAGYEFAGVAGNDVNWSQVNATTLEYNSYAGPLAPQASTVLNLKLRIVRTTGGEKDWINYAEVKSVRDENGDDRTDDDVDSDPESDSDYERDVEPGDDFDDDITGGGEFDGEDEDDHDPAGFEIFDLALIKQNVTAGPHYYGQVLEFKFSIYNQGSRASTGMTITDTIPCGYEYVTDGSNAGWVYDAGSNEATYDYDQTLVPGADDMISMFLRLQQCSDNPGEAWTNISEIKDAKDENGDPEDDFDGDFDDDPKDDDVVNDEVDDPNDEDNHDPEKPVIFDLAVKKRAYDRGPFAPGETAPFYITVFNQGNVEAVNIQLNDYLNQGFVFNAGDNDVEWSQLDAETLVYNSIASLLPGDSVNIDLNLEVVIAANPTLDDWINWGEVRSSDGVDHEGNDLDDPADADSNPNSDADHERDVLPGDADDDNIDGDYNNEGEDEDDHDVADVLVTGGLGDKVWKDLDGDGIQDEGEPGVEGVIVSLYTCAGEFVRKDTTDADGFYYFDFLLQDSYYAVFDISPLGNPDCVFTFANEGSDDSVDSDVNAAGVGPCTFVEAGEQDSTYDAGLVQLASLGDFVWDDLDGDGIQDFGEPGIADVIVKLYDASGTLVGQTETDANGEYLFDDLYPGEYYVEFEYMDMWSRSPANQGGDDARDSDVDDTNGPNTTRLIDLEPGENDLTWDLGLYKCIPVGDFVWFDVNANGVQDRPENGINGVRVYIYDGSGNLVDQAVTKGDPRSASKDGYYKFCVDPGTYYITFERPGHLAQSMSFAGGDSEKDSDITNTVELYSTYYFTVKSGDMRCDIDGGFHSKATMGDRVWHDKNGNGIQDAGEPRVEGAMISAFNTNGEEIWSDRSDPNGEFLMDALSTGEYYLEVNPPAGFTFTIPDQGGDDGIDSDVDGSNGPRTTALYRVTPGEHEPDVDAGLVDGFLPVELIEFNAVYRGEKVEVTWMTAVEINNEYYEVERRHESEDVYRVVGSVRAAGTVYTTQDYGYDDYDVSRTGVYYYRLRQVDTDGTEARSEVRTVEVMGGGNGVTLYPNPASTVVNVEMRVSQEGEARIELVDQLGRSLPEYTKTRDLESGTTVEEIKIDNLAPGMYTVQVKIGDDIQRIRFTKM